MKLFKPAIGLLLYASGACVFLLTIVAFGIYEVWEKISHSLFGFSYQPQRVELIPIRQKASSFKYNQATSVEVTLYKASEPSAIAITSEK